jgi:hypothetical protein
LLRATRNRTRLEYQPTFGLTLGIHIVMPAKAGIHDFSSKRRISIVKSRCLTHTPAPESKTFLSPAAPAFFNNQRLSS